MRPLLVGVVAISMTVCSIQHAQTPSTTDGPASSTGNCTVAVSGNGNQINITSSCGKLSQRQVLAIFKKISESNGELRAYMEEGFKQLNDRLNEMDQKWTSLHIPEERDAARETISQLLYDANTIMSSTISQSTTMTVAGPEHAGVGVNGPGTAYQSGNSTDNGLYNFSAGTGSTQVDLQNIIPTPNTKFSVPAWGAASTGSIVDAAATPSALGLMQEPSLAGSEFTVYQEENSSPNRTGESALLASGITQSPTNFSAASFESTKFIVTSYTTPGSLFSETANPTVVGSGWPMDGQTGSQSFSAPFPIAEQQSALSLPAENPAFLLPGTQSNPTLDANIGNPVPLATQPGTAQPDLAHDLEQASRLVLDVPSAGWDIKQIGSPVQLVNTSADSTAVLAPNWTAMAATTDRTLDEFVVRVIVSPNSVHPQDKTGFFVDDHGLIVTTRIDESNLDPEVEVICADGRSYTASVLSPPDGASQIAVIRISRESRALELTTGPIKNGESIRVPGFFGTLGVYPSLGSVVSGSDAPYFRVLGLIPRGYDGAPILDDSNRVLGLVVGKEADNFEFQGLTMDPKSLADVIDNTH